MARRPTTFRQQDVIRALRAARAAGLVVVGYEVDAATGKIIVNTNGNPKEDDGKAAFDRWLASKKLRSTPDAS